MPRRCRGRNAKLGGERKRMSYIAFITDQFNELVSFYGDLLAFPVVAEWDRARGRGRRFDLGGGLRLEILDNRREPRPLTLDGLTGRCHVVVEVDDVDAARQRFSGDIPPVRQVSWGARLFELRDPDGIPVTFLQWDQPRKEQA